MEGVYVLIVLIVCKKRRLRHISAVVRWERGNEEGGVGKYGTCLEFKAFSYVHFHNYVIA